MVLSEDNVVPVGQHIPETPVKTVFAGQHVLLSDATVVPCSQQNPVVPVKVPFVGQQV